MIPFDVTCMITFNVTYLINFDVTHMITFDVTHMITLQTLRWPHSRLCFVGSPVHDFGSLNQE